MRFGERARELAGLAASLLGWRPDEFWESTPAELETALGIGGSAVAEIGREELSKLQALFPDKRDT